MHRVRFAPFAKAEYILEDGAAAVDEGGPSAKRQKTGSPSFPPSEER